MGIYLNPRNDRFKQARNSRIYVDKSGLICETNIRMHSEQKYLCVSRPRRFGKSLNLGMLAAYYSRGFLSESKTKKIEDVLSLLQKRMWRDFKRLEVDLDPDDSLTFWMTDVYQETGIPFVILIDEWDCVMREHRGNREALDSYLDFLRSWLKDQDYVALAYMTGILPIKKYGTHSALNMFDEFSMLASEKLQRFTGFTNDEVKELCEQYTSGLPRRKSRHSAMHTTATSTG